MPGDRFVVENRRGEVYEPTFIWNGPPEAGLYVRHKGSIGRLADHSEWATFQRLLGGELLVRGDEVFLELRGPNGAVVEVRGTFQQLAPAGVVVAVDSPDKPVTFQLRDVMSGSFKLLLASRKLIAGEEFADHARRDRDPRRRAGRERALLRRRAARRGAGGRDRPRRAQPLHDQRPDPRFLARARRLVVLLRATASASFRPARASRRGGEQRGSR